MNITENELITFKYTMSKDKERAEKSFDDDLAADTKAWSATKRYFPYLPIPPATNPLVCDIIVNALNEDPEERAVKTINSKNYKMLLDFSEKKIKKLEQLFKDQDISSNPANDVYIDARSHLKINGQLISTEGLITDQMGILPPKAPEGSNEFEKVRSKFINLSIRLKQLELEKEIRDKMIKEQNNSQASNIGLNDILNVNSAGGVSTQDTGLAVNNTNQQTMG